MSLVELREEEGVMVKGRAIIDTRPPFRSVKEAVALFGEKVLVEEIYAKQFKDKEIQTNKVKSKKEESHKGTPTTPPHAVENVTTTELEETKENLKKAKEEGEYMVNCLKSLKEELEQTKKELGQLKAAKQAIIVIDQNAPINPEIEELKYVETNNNNNAMSKRDVIDEDDDDHDHETQKKKFVSFASPPSLTRDITKYKSRNSNNDKKSNVVGDQSVGADYVKFGRTASFRKDGKKKPLIPIVSWLFSNKKKDRYQYHASAHRSPTAS